MAVNAAAHQSDYAARFVHRKRSAEGGVKSPAGVKEFRFIRLAACFMSREIKVGIVRLDALAKTSKEIQFAVQSGPMLLENGVINPRIHPNVASRKIRNGVRIVNKGTPCFC